MDNAEAGTSQDQLIVFPAQPFGIHYLDNPMWVPRIHARKHEERDLPSLTDSGSNVFGNIRLEIYLIWFGHSNLS
jgi:hypothetical protein